MRHPALTILASLILAAASAAGGQTVRLHPAATVEAGAVRLADVAAMDGLDPADGEVVVLTLPAAGSVRRLPVRQLQEALWAGGMNVGPVRFAGAAWCDVHWAPPAAEPEARDEGPPPAVQPAPAAVVATAASTETAGEAPAAEDMSLAARIRALVAGQLGADARSIEIEFASSDRGKAALAPRGTVSISSSDREVLGRRHWRIETIEGTRRYRYYLSGTVRVRRSVLAAVRDLPAGTVLTAADVAPVERPDDGAAAWLADAGMVVGRQAVRAIAAGQALAASDVRTPRFVQRGQTATIFARAGALEVRYDARALADGHEGQVVDFERVGTRDRVRATVTGPGRACIGGGEEAMQ